MAAETTVMRVLLLTFSRISPATLALASHEINWAVLNSLEVMVLIIGFKHEVTIKMGRETRGITFSAFGRILSMCCLIISVSRRIWTARLSATRNFSLFWKCLFVMWSFSCPKHQIGSFVVDVNSFELIFSLKENCSSRMYCIVIGFEYASVWRW